jgi:hypothetical protein
MRLVEMHREVLQDAATDYLSTSALANAPSLAVVLIFE